MIKNKIGISILLFISIIVIALTTLDVVPFLINKSKLGFVFMLILFPSIAFLIFKVKSEIFLLYAIFEIMFSIGSGIWGFYTELNDSRMTNLIIIFTAVFLLSQGFEDFQNALPNKKKNDL